MQLQKPFLIIISLATALAFWAFLQRPGFTDQENSENPVKVQDFLGVNTYNIQFKPDLYSPVFRHVRDYHTFGLDVGEDTSSETNFPYSRHEMWWEDETGVVGDFSGLINWGEMYQSWVDHGFDVNVSIMLTHDHPDRWNDLEADAYQYGKAFAEYFGPNGRGIVSSVEIGNEPVPVWPIEAYQRLFPAMAQGIRDGDPDLKILTAATRAGRVDEYSMPIQVFEQHSGLFDVVKMHNYAMIPETRVWERSFPEDPKIEYLTAVENTLKWRDHHAPEAKLWITEFGYDTISEKPAEDPQFHHYQGVPDLVQAQWLVRSVFEFMRLGVDRAYIFWFNDDDERAFHGASGIMRFYEPKKSYWAFKHLQETLGAYSFRRVIKRESGSLFLYEFVSRTDSGEDVAYVVWSPTGEAEKGGSGRSRMVTLDVPATPDVVERMAVSEQGGEEVPYRMAGENQIEIEIGESPVYLKFSR